MNAPCFQFNRSLINFALHFNTRKIIRKTQTFQLETCKVPTRILLAVRRWHGCTVNRLTWHCCCVVELLFHNLSNCYIALRLKLPFDRLQCTEYGVKHCKVRHLDWIYILRDPRECLCVYEYVQVFVVVVSFTHKIHIIRMKYMFLCDENTLKCYESLKFS